MKIEHVAIWTTNLERLKTFYELYFNATAGEKYTNDKKQFESYFLTFETGCRLEIMQKPSLTNGDLHDRTIGLAHLAVATGSRQLVNELTERLRSDGHIIAGEPRVTGDGYYESVVLDPDGNRIELTE